MTAHKPVTKFTKQIKVVSYHDPSVRNVKWTPVCHLLNLIIGDFETNQSFTSIKYDCLKRNFKRFIINFISTTDVEILQTVSVSSD